MRVRDDACRGRARPYPAPQRQARRFSSPRYSVPGDMSRGAGQAQGIAPTDLDPLGSPSTHERGTMQLAMPRRLRGTIDVPGDKSISHRSVMFNAVAEGNAVITNFLTGADCLSTIACMRAMGVQIEQEGTTVRVKVRPTSLRVRLDTVTPTELPGFRICLRDVARQGEPA